MDNISWTDGVRNEEVLHIFKERSSAPHTVTGRKGNSIGHNWRRNCLLKHVIEAMIQ
jgi:hypothetical protein